MHDVTLRRRELDHVRALGQFVQVVGPSLDHRGTLLQVSRPVAVPGVEISLPGGLCMSEWCRLTDSNC
jgi:hypothetical protein